jgi:hypothetical protein
MKSERDRKRILRTTKSERDRKRILRRTLILPYLFAAALLLPLALIRRCDTRVNADVTVREFSFDLADDSSRVLVDARNFDALFTLYRLHGEFIAGDQVHRVETGPEGSLSVRPARLNALQLTSGGHVALRRGDASSLGISIMRSEVVADIGFGNSAEVECDYCTVDGAFHEHLQPGFRQNARLRLSSVDSQLHLILTTSAPAVIADRMAIRNLSFRSGFEAPTSSLVADGALTLPDIAAAPPIPLHAENPLMFHNPHDFVIEKVDVAPQGLRVQLTGWTDGVSTQSDGKNELPSLLQRLHLNQALVLYGGLILLVAGTIITALRHLQFIESPK